MSNLVSKTIQNPTTNQPPVQPKSRPLEQTKWPLTTKIALAASGIITVPGLYLAYQHFFPKEIPAASNPLGTVLKVFVPLCLAGACYYYRGKNNQENSSSSSLTKPSNETVSNLYDKLSKDNNEAGVLKTHQEILKYFETLIVNPNDFDGDEKKFVNSLDDKEKFLFSKLKDKGLELHIKHKEPIKDDENCILMQRMDQFFSNNFEDPGECLLSRQNKAKTQKELFAVYHDMAEYLVDALNKMKKLERPIVDRYGYPNFATAGNKVFNALVGYFTKNGFVGNNLKFIEFLESGKIFQALNNCNASSLRKNLEEATEENKFQALQNATTYLKNKEKNEGNENETNSADRLDEDEQFLFDSLKTNFEAKMEKIIKENTFDFLSNVIDLLQKGDITSLFEIAKKLINIPNDSLQTDLSRLSDKIIDAVLDKKNETTLNLIYFYLTHSNETNSYRVEHLLSRMLKKIKEEDGEFLQSFLKIILKEKNEINESCFIKSMIAFMSDVRYWPKEENVYNLRELKSKGIQRVQTIICYIAEKGNYNLAFEILKNCVDWYIKDTFEDMEGKVLDQLDKNLPGTAKTFRQFIEAKNKKSQDNENALSDDDTSSDSNDSQSGTLSIDL
jgi:hypothetical protein